MNEKKQDDIEPKNLDLIMEEWKTVIQTQMHFNDMLMKMRTAAISVVVAIYAVAGALVGQFPNSFLVICGKQVHISILIIGFGITLWIGIFLIDYKYYYKMLLGAVERGYEFDEAFSNVKVYKDLSMFGLSSKIRDKIGKPGASKWYVIAYYGIVLCLAVVYLIIVLLST